MWAAPTVLRGRRAVDRHGVVWQPSDRATTRSGRWSTLQCCSRRPVGMLGRPNIDRRRLHTAVPSHPLGRIPRRPVPAPAGFNVASAAPHLQALPESRPAAQTTESAGRVAGTPAPESGAGHLRPRTGSGPSPRRLPVGRTVGLLCRLPAAVCGDGRNHLGGQGHPVRACSGHAAAANAVDLRTVLAVHTGKRPSGPTRDPNGVALHRSGPIGRWFADWIGPL